MTEAGGRVGSTTQRRHLVHSLYVMLMLALLLGAAEWILRARGFAPWQPQHPSIRIEPGGKLTQPHALLGYSAIPGAFVAADDTGASTQFTHLPSTLRITRPLSEYSDSQERPEVWVFGCSFTYGSGLNDHETWPWQLQERLPDHEVVNFGMGGYGTVHSLLQLREALEERRPKLALLAYASFHDVRNTFLRIRRKAVVPYSRLGPFAQPFASLDARGRLELQHATADYREFPLMRRSALVHLIEQEYDELEQRLHDSHAVSEALVLEMDRLAREHGVVFVVADIWDGESMLRSARENGIASVDISLPRDPRYTLAPEDGHPNPRAARIYAERLARFLAPLL